MEITDCDRLQCIYVYQAEQNYRKRRQARALTLSSIGIDGGITGKGFHFFGKSKRLFHDLRIFFVQSGFDFQKSVNPGRIIRKCSGLCD
jgi:hypothetical protein